MSTSIVDRFAGLRVAVLGEAVLDGYLEGRSRRLCQEAPVPVVELARRSYFPGGAANTAANVASLGARVSLLSVIGQDEPAGSLRRLLRERGIDDGLIVSEPARRTLCKTRVVAGDSIIVRMDEGDTHAIDRASEQRLLDALAIVFAQADAVVVSDYRYGVVTPAVIARLAELQRSHRRVIVADSKDLSLYAQVGVTAVKPNFEQAVKLLGIQEPADRESRADLMSVHAHRLLETTGAQLAAVTLDSEGALLLERSRPPYRTYASPRSSANASGAGDTFVAALALALAAGADTPEAAELASSAAEVVVGAVRTAECSAVELRQHETLGEKLVRDLNDLKARAELYRKQGRRIVFTNGCFDILHRGHITYLNRAKRLGDVLVIAVNSDPSVARLKGDSRPINSLEDRLQVLAALSCVDHVIPFDEDLPHRPIEAVRPDVFVKGGDYTKEMLPEAALVESLGGKVEILPYEEGRSTSGLIERIVANAADDEPS